VFFSTCKHIQQIDTWPTGTCIEKEGDEGHKFYLILGGTVSVETVEPGASKVLSISDSFGKEAVRCNNQYPASYFVQNTPLLLISVKKRDYDKRMLPFNARDLKIKEREYRSISAFMHWSDEDIGNLASATLIRRFEVGQELIKEGQKQDNIMIIIKGFCEMSKTIHGDKTETYGTLGLGDTLDIEHVLQQVPVSYTATAAAIVDVMLLHLHLVVQPKDGPKLDSFKPLLDNETIKKLLQRESKPPTTCEMQLKLAENENSWALYKKQLVSGLVWDVRYKKFTDGSKPSGNVFNKYVHIDIVKSAGDLSSVEAPGEHHKTLTSHISPAVLPPSVQTAVKEREKSVLDR
jgi:CRP-like cAMP-binding protein